MREFKKRDGKCSQGKGLLHRRFYQVKIKVKDFYMEHVNLCVGFPFRVVMVFLYLKWIMEVTEGQTDDQL